MSDARSIRFRVAVAVLMALPAIALAPAVAAAPALTVDDIASLLEAGIGESVILKQMSLSGTRLILTVDGMIRLKKAGASDELLEALVAAPPESTPLPLPADILQDDGDHSFRVYSEVDENGDAVVHVTNLDESGRRIGGEVERTSYPNVVRPSEAPRREAEYRDDDPRSVDAGDRGQVVVNVYPPDSGSSGPDGRDPYLRDARDRYLRFAPAYYGTGPSYHHFHTPTCGHLNYYYGRYSPYAPYGVAGYRTIGGGPGRGLGVPFLGSIRTVPYSHGSAAVRNQKAFGRR